MTSRLRSPRKSIFSRPSSSTPCISYCVTIGASSIGVARLRLALHRQVLGERLAGDHDRGGVDAVLAAQALEALGDVDDARGLGVGGVELAELAGHLVAVLELRVRLQARVERRVAAHDQRRHHLGDLVADRVRVGRAPAPRRGPRPAP